MKNLKKEDPKIYQSIVDELNRQRNTIELIASENFASHSILEVAGSVLTNKYAEGYPGRRYYGGCESVDVAENIARDRLKKLFKKNYLNVKRNQGSKAIMGVFIDF